MRMSCNSTYLLDQETDHGVKADELAALLDGLLVQPDAKAVVFSQWTRTHDIVIRRLEARGLGYVSFHGGVASDQRPALVQRFRDDPDCRVFLSTDAGATGLNLQHASILVNMDLPWNPAVLEQRIGRIHRMGQKRRVQIVNFVAKGTIEEGMLSVLAFKRSLSAGILDGGSNEISLGGSRLSRFMKDVESVTGRMGEGEAMAPAEEAASVAAAAAESPVEAAESAVEAAETAAMDGSPGAGDTASQAGAAAPEAAGDPWAALLRVGAQFVSALGAAGDAEAAPHPWVERDPATGARSLRLPLPPPETARRLADALSAIADSLRGKAADS
jgi:superfamily II DNA/RNA helicase